MSFHNSYFEGAQDAHKFNSFIEYLHRTYGKQNVEQFNNSMQELMANVDPSAPFLRAKREPTQTTVYLKKNDKEIGKIVFS